MINYTKPCAEFFFNTVKVPNPPERNLQVGDFIWLNDNRSINVIVTVQESKDGKVTLSNGEIIPANSLDFKNKHLNPKVYEVLGAKFQTREMKTFIRHER